MGANDEVDGHVSRRGFLGWGATLLTAVVVPGATLMLTETAAAAATMTPYAMATWLSLSQRSVQVSAPGRSMTTLKVTKVTNLAIASRKRMTGEVFLVGFQASKVVTPGMYTVTAAGVGSFLLSLEGQGTDAHAVINTRVPA